MRIVISLLSAGFLKNFESGIVGLAERGHDVHLLVQKSTGLVGAEDLGVQLAERFPNVTYEREQIPRDGWQSVSVVLRACEDFLQFLEPIYSASYRLRAKSRTPRAFRRLIKRKPFRGPRRRRMLARFLRVAEETTPVSPGVRAHLAALDPDVLVLTPYIGLSTTQPSWMHAARALGIPTAVCVASWDHLTSKSRMHPTPDLITVWNETQRREALELHRLPAERIAITGAQLFDQWFDWLPSSREAFCEQVGLDPARPFLLYTCFSPFKAARSEAEFVVEWIERLRGDERLADCQLLIRPHPKRTAQWLNADLGDLEDVVVWPRDGRYVIDAESKAGFFDSLHHSAAVVGLNSSAMIEAAIVGRRVHTLLVPEYFESQEGTLHFRYLMDATGGLLRVARTYEEHLDQLAQALADGPDASEENRAFVESFVRPHGLDEAATPRFVAAIEGLAGAHPAVPRRRRFEPVLRLLMRPVVNRLETERRVREERAAAALVSRRSAAALLAAETSEAASP